MRPMEKSDTAHQRKTGREYSTQRGSRSAGHVTFATPSIIFTFSSSVRRQLPSRSPGFKTTLVSVSMWPLPLISTCIVV